MRFLSSDIANLLRKRAARAVEPGRHASRGGVVAVKFAESRVPNDDGDPVTIDLARKMLVVLLVGVEELGLSTPHRLGGLIGERNQHAVREAGRLLVQLGIAIAAAEPYESAEGERVLGYSLRDAIRKDYSLFAQRYGDNFESEFVAAIKQ